MILNKLDGLEEYAKYLREHAAEVENLYQDILINVTSFFRDPEAFEVLKEKIFPRLVEHRAPDEPVRIWVVGCSTGEEAYSIAMAFTEFAGEGADHIPVQIFATDLNQKGIEKARAGLYRRTSRRTSRRSDCAASEAEGATASASRSATCASSRDKTSSPTRLSRGWT